MSYRQYYKYGVSHSYQWRYTIMYTDKNKQRIANKISMRRLRLKQKQSIENDKQFFDRTYLEN